MMPNRWAPAVLAAVFALAGCGGAQARFDGSTFRDGKVAFRVAAVPASWRRIDVGDASLAFRDDAHDASILLNGRCGQKDDDTPLPALTSHLLIGTTERDISSEKIVPLDGRDALHSLLRAKLDGVPMAYDVFVLKKDGCVYDFVRVAPPRASAPDPEFERFVSSFHTIGAGDL